MAYSFLVFEFGGDEDIAQQARHKVDGWKQGFRLGKKLELKFDRKEPEVKAEAASEVPSKPAQETSKTKGKSKTASKSGGKAGHAAESKSGSGPLNIRLIVRLDFSDHEKLSNQRWLDRIPGEEPFKSAKSSILRAGDPEFKKTSDLFQSLN
jgi:hypothetical protein